MIVEFAWFTKTLLSLLGLLGLLGADVPKCTGFTRFAQPKIKRPGVLCSGVLFSKCSGEAG